MDTLDKINRIIRLRLPVYLFGPVFIQGLMVAASLVRTRFDVGLENRGEFALKFP